MRDGAAHDAREKVVGRDVTLRFVGVVHEHDVDIGPRVQLETTELAHAEDAQLGGRAVFVARRAEARRDVGGRLGDGHFDHSVSQLGQLARGFG